MRSFKLFALIFGLVMLGLVVWQVDLAAVWSHIRPLGGWGMAAVVGLYAIAFAIDTLSWQIVILEARLDFRWWYRIWKIRLVGEFLNSVVPLGGVGGEPVKALMLKRYYGVGYRAGAAALILGKTTDMISLVLFLAISFTLVLTTGVLDTGYKLLAGTGLGVFSLAIVLFFLVQRYRLATKIGNRLKGGRLDRRFGIGNRLHHVEDMDDRLVGFYTGHKGRTLAAVALGLFNWMLGAAEIWLVMWLLGIPMTIVDAVIIEGVTQLVRNGTFFIPASIGTQEGAFLVLFGAVAGSPELGLAVAFIRRGRELIWLAWGALMGWIYTHSPAMAINGENADAKHISD